MQLSHEHKNNIVAEFDEVSFAYDKHLALEKVSFKIERGDYVGLVGPNGGGKTTVLKLLLGLLRPESGEVRIFGQNIRKVRQERAHVGYVPQRATQSDPNFPLTVEEAVLSARVGRLAFFGWPNEEEKKEVQKAMQIVDIDNLSSRRLGELSGGQRQRALIARALATSPEMLVLDEPTVGVDPVTEKSFYELLAKLNKELGLTIVLVSHDIDVVHKEVGKLLCLNRRLVYYGDARGALKNLDFNKLYGDTVMPAFHGH